MIENDSDKRKGWTTDQISSDVAMKGFHGPMLSVREVGETERFFVDALGSRRPAPKATFIVSKSPGAAPPRPSL